jgi:hypothetical protein
VSKTLIWDFKKMAAKFKMASETYTFVILLSKLKFSTDLKSLDCGRSVFLFSNFCRKNFFSRIQNMTDFPKMPSFLRKNQLSLNPTFFKNSKSYPAIQMDGWILGGGDRAPARGPRFGLIVLQYKGLRYIKKCQTKFSKMGKYVL